MNQSDPQPPPETDTADAYAETYASAVRLLARREHSVLELRRKLRGRAFDPEQVEAVLAELRDVGYLSDKRFAEVYVRGRFERGMGPLRIAAELRERGIDEALMQGVFEALAGAWAESARQQREKRFGSRPPEDIRDRGRQMRFLQQRGLPGSRFALFLTVNPPDYLYPSTGILYLSAL